MKRNLIMLVMAGCMGLAIAAQAKQTTPTPVIAPVAGTYYGSVGVTITCATTGAEIHYSTNGVDVTADSDLYTGTITLSSSATVKAKAFKTGWNDSLQAESAFDLQPP